MYNIKKFLAYALLVISTIFIIKTLPSALHEILMHFQINTKISIDVINCQTIFNSIIKANFEYQLFKVCLVSFLVSLIILLRKRTYSLSLISKNYNIIFLIGLFFFFLPIYVIFMLFMNF